MNALWQPSLSLSILQALEMASAKSPPETLASNVDVINPEFEGAHSLPKYLSAVSAEKTQIETSDPR